MKCLQTLCEVSSGLYGNSAENVRKLLVSCTVLYLAYKFAYVSLAFLQICPNILQLLVLSNLHYKMTSAPSVIIVCIKKTETDVDNFNVQQGCGKLYTLQLTSSSQLLYTARLYVP